MFSNIIAIVECLKYNVYVCGIHKVQNCLFSLITPGVVNVMISGKLQVTMTQYAIKCHNLKLI